ncbi:MAG: hypothetical protein ACRDH9_06090 [Actinomycetota bacterium]
MALSAESLGDERLLRDYLRILSRDGHDESRLRSPGHDLRTCADCGVRTAFTLDPEGTWFRCSHCGAYA